MNVMRREQNGCLACEEYHQVVLLMRLSRNVAARYRLQYGDVPGVANSSLITGVMVQCQNMEASLTRLSQQRSHGHNCADRKALFAAETLRKPASVCV